MHPRWPTGALPRRRAVRASARRTIVAVAALPLTLFTAGSLRAQTLDDAEMLGRRELHVGVMYGSESWDEYWEGTLRRSNGNVGTVTTRSVSVHAGYGVTPRLSILAALPYVWTEASQGVLHGLSGRQDLTLLAKYRVANPMFAGRARLKVVAAAGASTPTSNYTPDLLPMSIGLQSRSLMARASAHLQDRTGWFVDGYAQRMWRSNVTLDRSAYYTDGQYFETDEVSMPDVAKYRGTVGWQRGRWCIPVGVTWQRTLGGGDIRRQDMPFVSNRMNATMAHAELMVFVPGAQNLRVDLGAARTLDGRNVGRSTSFMTGLSYALHL
jgi:hypothetical protein